MADPITVQILRNKIAGLTDEMHYHFYRSGYSTIIRESRDFSCVVLDRSGGLIVAPPMFFHAPVYKHLVGRIIELHGMDGLRDGDVFVCNHPYEGGLPHGSDMAFVAPIFADGAVVGFSGSIAHKADIGIALDGDADRLVVADELLDTIGRSLLGMSIGCARCHDHKFDPIPTADYYALAGIFRSTKTLIHANVSSFVERAISDLMSSAADSLPPRMEAAASLTLRS